MSTFPAGAPSFQLPSPHRGMVYVDAGWIVVKRDGETPVRVYQLEAPARPVSQVGDGS